MSRHKYCANSVLFLICVFLLVFSTAGNSQTKTAPRQRTTNSSVQPATAAARPAEIRYKGIFEPVSYQEDLEFFDAFFTTPDEGWVAGEKGTILHTTDAGRTWKAQLGGNPQGTEQALRDLRFVDSKHGWAATSNGLGTPLLRTVDGQNWQQVGTIGDMYTPYQDYVFTSSNTGVYVQLQTIRRTTDGGKSWKDVLKPCAAKIQVQGITQQVGCSLKSVHFPTSNVGYTVGVSNAGGTMILAKTTDGGVTWGVATTPNAFTPDRDESAFKQYIFFLDENTGFVRFSDGKTIMTADGGGSWTPTGATVVDIMKFADPEVGWALNNGNFGFTTDGGRHWSARRFEFPAVVRGFSFPRRNRAYVVGQHGMIFRYSIVPENYIGPNMIEAPAMPGNSQLNTEAQHMRAQVAALRTQIQAQLGVAATPGSGQPPPVATSSDANASFQQDTSAQSSADASFQQSPTDNLAPSQPGAGSTTAAAPGGYFMDSCCAVQMNQLGQTVDSFSVDVPRFAGATRSLNLIIAGLNFVNDLARQAKALQTTLLSLRHAQDPQSALVALNSMSAQTDATANAANAGFQQDTGVAEQSVAGLQSSGFQSASQPAAQSPDQSVNSSQSTNTPPQQAQQQKKKSKWKIPSVSDIPIPH